MQFHFSTTHTSIPPHACVVVGVFSDESLTLSQNHPLYSVVCETIAHEKNLHGGQWKPKDETHTYPGYRIRYIGLGKKRSDVKTDLDWQECGANLVHTVHDKKNLFILLDGLSAFEARHMVIGAELNVKSYQGYKTEKKPLALENITFVFAQEVSLQEQAHDAYLRDALLWAREVVNHPGNVIHPESFCEILETFSKDGLEVKILKGDALKQWGALNGVAVGSAYLPHVAVLSWNGGDDKEKPIALVGKGVTFDSGGLSLKPSQSMAEMKTDKAGAVVVAAVMRLIAQRRDKINVVAVLPIVENMPSGSAQRPGDIVHSLSGKTIEVLDTDAEGRLILADALWYAQETFHPSVIVDLATLTGAVRVALGGAYAGLFSNNDALSQELLQAGQETGEALWTLPLHPSYSRAMESSIADLKNVASPGFGAGSSTAAAFLQKFIQKDVPWAHLDIAGVSNTNKKSSFYPTGTTAFGVNLLLSWMTGRDKKKNKS